MTLREAVALVFRRRGGVLSATDFKHTASFDLKWFPPREAGRLLERAKAEGLLVEEEGRLKPTFDVKAVDVPLDFVPDLDALAAPPEAAPSQAPARPLVDRLAEALRVSTDELIALAEQERARSQGLLHGETALLLAARRRGLDVRPFTTPVTAQ